MHPPGKSRTRGAVEEVGGRRSIRGLLDRRIHCRNLKFTFWRPAGQIESKLNRSVRSSPTTRIRGIEWGGNPLSVNPLVDQKRQHRRAHHRSSLIKMLELRTLSGLSIPEIFGTGFLLFASHQLATSHTIFPSNRLLSLGAAGLLVWGLWKQVRAVDLDDIDARIQNGYKIVPSATSETLDEATLELYALKADGTYRPPLRLSPDHETVAVPGGEAWGGKDARSSAAVWVTRQLLQRDECDAWVGRAEELELETGDFIFKTGKRGHERMLTGARRYSATKLVIDEAFAEAMTRKLQGTVPEKLSDGRRYRGVNSSFLVSRYVEGQYFAPHFDGNLTVEAGPMAGCVSEFTAVLYLSDDFEGGNTHYLPGQGSEVASPALSLKPPVGCAIIHRQGTVLHSGGKLLRGRKYIMQFGVIYDPLSEGQEPAVLRWGA